MENKPGDILNSLSPQVYTPALPEGADTLTAEMVNLPEGFADRVLIPEGVQRIDGDCFQGEPITAVSFPKSLREIGMGAFLGCRLGELRVEGDGRKIIILALAFAINPELTAITLGNCELESRIFWKCPVSRVTLTGKCFSKYDIPLGFGGCRGAHKDKFFGTVRRYKGALGTYALKGELARTNYKSDGDFKGCAICNNPCYTLSGFEDDYGKTPVYEWEKVE